MREESLEILSSWPLPKPEIWISPEVGTSSDEGLFALRDSLVDVVVDFYEPNIPIPRRVTLHDRARILEIRHIARLSEALAFWPGERHPTVITYDSRPDALAGRLPAALVADLRRLPVSTICVEKLVGQRARKPRERKHYSLRCRFVRHLEGETRGKQLCEERVLLVRAVSEEAARRKVMREHADDGGYMHDNGAIERWLLEGIVDVCEPVALDLEDEIAEVYYRFYNRVNAKKSERRRAPVVMKSKN